MTRRELIALTGCWLSGVSIGSGQDQPARRGLSTGTQPAPPGDADVTLRIGELTLDLAPRLSIRTVAYNGQVPGPLLRAKAGQPLTIDVRNNTNNEEIVHWHGLHVPSDVDGAREEGTPAVPPRGGSRRYVFTPGPTGTRWYHSHGMANRNLNRSTYTGQFGMFIIDSGDEAGAFDQEIPILLHEWDPRFADQGPMDVEFRYFSINGKMLGAGEPVRVRQNQRVLFRLVNASATLHHRLALPGHLFLVTALDGYPVPSPTQVPVIAIGPGERVDAIVDMNHPGVWVLGEVEPEQRNGGMGIIIEYSGQQGSPQWQSPRPFTWDYTSFGGAGAVSEPDGRLTLVFRATTDGHHWTINGKSYPRTEPIIVQRDKRYRWLLDNQSADDHPVHLHRHAFEVVRVGDKNTSGVLKDVVVVPAWKQVEIDVLATHPGLSLFHCHQQFHMDMGFMAMMSYRE